MTPRGRKLEYRRLEVGKLFSVRKDVPPGDVEWWPAVECSSSGGGEVNESPLWAAWCSHSTLGSIPASDVGGPQSHLCTESLGSLGLPRMSGVHRNLGCLSLSLLLTFPNVSPEKLLLLWTRMVERRTAGL